MFNLVVPKHRRRSWLKSSSLAMEYRAALAIIQLTLVSVYSRKSSLWYFTSDKTVKLKLKASLFIFFPLETPVELTNIKHWHSKLKV